MLLDGSRIEVYRDGETKLRWRVVAADGTILAVSRAGYESVGGAVNGLRVVRAILIFGSLGRVRRAGGDQAASGSGPSGSASPGPCGP